MNEVSEERRLFREAADLVIRLQNDAANPVSVDIVRSWISRSPAHEDAWRRVATLHGMTGKILTDRQRAKTGPNRRSFMAGGLVALTVGGIGSLTLPGLILKAQADHLTSVGEIKTVPLSDGSVVTLGPDSAIGVDYTEKLRGISLLAGMAYFEVVPDNARPFMVESASFKAKTQAAAFDFSNDADVISVSVDQGLIDITAPGFPADGIKQLGAGEWLQFDPNNSTLNRGNLENAQVAAWRKGMIVAEKETVAALVAKIARWQSGKVIIADRSLGSKIVSGVFDLNDPVRALEAVVRPFGAKLRQVAPFLTVISSV
ncbi:FecR family protein [Ochrobactrum sp. EDr1-4]|uniref:FecR family protein n=1 Tax=Ochrobactrum sp. EDr1-4 TaxID=3368622 RepID=UPI003BA16517